MASTYCMGVFNDNFFKQASCLLAIYIGRAELQGTITIIFTLPWLLFAAPAGWLADRFPKRGVVIAAKALELLAMLLGAVGILTVQWTLVMVMMFLMALQSTIFSPALNGSIPELYPRTYVLQANSILKLVTTCSILLGIIFGGMALAVKQPLFGVPAGRVIIAAVVVVVAFGGWLVSLFVPRRPAADVAARFPWAGPVQTLKQLLHMRRDRLLWIVVLLDSFVWFVAVFQVLTVNQLGKRQFGLNEAQTSYLLVSELAGVAVGGAIIGRVCTGLRWFRLLVPATAGLAILTGLIAAMDLLPSGLHLPWVIGGLLLAGVSGGMLLVPLESFFQVRPDPHEKGAVIAAANFAGFFAMMLAGGADLALTVLETPPLMRFGLLSAACAVVVVWLRWALRKETRI